MRLLAACLACLPCAAFGGELAVAIGETIVTYQVPDGWETAYQSETDKSFIRGEVPAGEAKSVFSQALTLTASRNLAGLPNVSTVDFVNYGLSALKGQCLGEFAFAQVETDAMIGGQPVLAVHLTCTKGANRAGLAENSLLVAFRGGKDFYALQWMESAPSGAVQTEYDAAHWQDRFQQMLTGTRLCAGVPGVTPAPCPAAP